ncbi:hypothetical protein BN2476_60023 [Paraburkholderia piptadeniae]|uniref:Uncharacterized protein n=1 Tax=Paraburkholderia piptadeniae TaxID=1701573 RepID=A0A1N7RKX3_9BURK|nr:hypothetical protein BN2476_60023 [Paraburkholderia piptadeniae]
MVLAGRVQYLRQYFSHYCGEYLFPLLVDAERPRTDSRMSVSQLQTNGRFSGTESAQRDAVLIMRGDV